VASTRTHTKSFAGGEVTEEFWGRIDDGKYQTGLALCRNFITLPHGPVANRPGTAFVREVADSSKATRIIPFVYSTEQSMVLEFGDGVIRFHTAGATLLAGSPAAYNGATAYVVGDLVSSSGTNYYCVAATTGNAPPNATYWYALPSAAYEIPSPYDEADLFALHYVQSADVLTIVHPSYAARELRRLGATQWVLSVVSFASTLSPPGNVTATATVTGTDLIDHEYVVTAIDGGVDESLVSSSDDASNNLNAVGAYNTITWDAVTGAVRYNVYKLDNGLYGYLGQTTLLTFRDDNITPDVSKTPPEANDPISGAGEYPAAVSYHEQRRAFGGTTNRPQNLWMTRSGTESNLTYSIPPRDDDAISFRVAARQANTIRHIVPMQDMVILTSSAVWRVWSVNSDALTALTFNVKPQSFVGANNVQPVVANENLVYAASRGGHARQLSYVGGDIGYESDDLSLRAPHLFNSLTVVDMAFAEAPYPIVWMVSSNGKLLGLTYLPKQEVFAWHQHDTLGTFESVCAVPEGDEDAVYVVVNRTVGEATVRYVERFASRLFGDAEDAFFVDAGITYDGTPITTVTDGLDHLEGLTVNILGDGAVYPPQVVDGGGLPDELPAATSVLQIGLPITGQLRTLPAAFEMPGVGSGRPKSVDKVWVRLYESGAPKIGPALNKLVQMKIRTNEPYGTPPGLKSWVRGVPITPDWSEGGQVYIEHTDPTPITITSLSLEVTIGG